MSSVLLSGSSPQADAGGVGPALNLGFCCLPLPGPSCLADVQYCCLHPGSSKVISQCLSVLIWVFGSSSLSPLWVQVQPVLVAVAWTHLCVDRQPGSGLGWGCFWSLPGRASNPCGKHTFCSLLFSYSRRYAGISSF